MVLRTNLPRIIGPRKSPEQCALTNGGWMEESYTTVIGLDVLREFRFVIPYGT